MADTAFNLSHSNSAVVRAFEGIVQSCISDILEHQKTPNSVTPTDLKFSALLLHVVISNAELRPKELTIFEGTSRSLAIDTATIAAELNRQILRRESSLFGFLDALTPESLRQFPFFTEINSANITADLLTSLYHLSVDPNFYSKVEDLTPKTVKPTRPKRKVKLDQLKTPLSCNAPKARKENTEPRSQVTPKPQDGPANSQVVTDPSIPPPSSRATLVGSETIQSSLLNSLIVVTGDPATTYTQNVDRALSKVTEGRESDFNRVDMFWLIMFASDGSPTLCKRRCTSSSHGFIDEIVKKILYLKDLYIQPQSWAENPQVLTRAQRCKEYLGARQEIDLLSLPV